MAGKNHIALVQGSTLDQDRSDSTPALIESGFDHDAAGRTVGNRLELQHLGLQQDGVEQFVNAGTGLG